MLVNRLVCGKRPKSALTFNVYADQRHRIVCQYTHSKWEHFNWTEAKRITATTAATINIRGTTLSLIDFPFLQIPLLRSLAHFWMIFCARYHWVLWVANASVNHGGVRSRCVPIVSTLHITSGKKKRIIIIRDEKKKQTNKQKEK